MSTTGPVRLPDGMRTALIESRLTPNAISLTGLALNLLAAYLIIEELWIPAAFAFIIGSVLDTLDGWYARMSGKGTPFGAFLDSTLDRIEEGAVLTCIAVVFAKDAEEVVVGAVVAAVVGSILVSYTRARAEALGIECKEGLATRAVRVVIISAGLMLADLDVADTSILEYSIYVLAALTLFTMLQRIFVVRKKTLLPPAAD